MRNRSGFTLIELLIVVVIIGLLAAIALPKFDYTKQKAFASTMKSDLRNLATAQENYFYENATYTTDITSLQYRSSAGVTVSIAAATGKGWAASATHPASYPFTCALFYGNVAALAPATVEGQIGCQ